MILNNKPFEVIEHRGSSVIGKFKRNKQLIHVSTLSLRHEMDVYPFIALYKTPDGLCPGVLYRNNYQVQSYKLNYIDKRGNIKTIDIYNSQDYIPINILTHPNLIRTNTRDYLIANYDWVLAETTEGRMVGMYFRDTIFTEKGNFDVLSIIKPVKRNARKEYCAALNEFKERARIGRYYQYLNREGNIRKARDYRTHIDDVRFMLNNYTIV